MYYEMDESERFAQTIEIEINESNRFTQTRASIHILALLSESYFQKKIIQNLLRRKSYIRFRN